ncbi:hypothetical protein ACFLZO_01495 [Patescibacteria group bacterium]
MSSVKDSLSKNAVRISMGLVILFAIAAIAMTTKFVLFYSSVQEVGTDASSRTTNTLDKELFDDVTAARDQKTADRESANTDIRDPFSEPYEPPPPPDDVEEESPEVSDNTDGSPEPVPEE